MPGLRETLEAALDRLEALLHDATTMPEAQIPDVANAIEEEGLERIATVRSALERLREERDTATPLHALREKNRELRASLEAAEAEVRRLKQENDELAEQAYQDRSKAQRLTEGLREYGHHKQGCNQLKSPGLGRSPEFSGQECDCGLAALLSASPSDDKPAICHICGNTVEGEHKIWCSASPSDGGGA